MFITMQKLFSVIFIIMTFGGMIVNFVKEGPALREGIVGMRPPDSVADVGKNIQWIDEVARSTIAYKFQFVEAYGFIQVLLGKREYGDFTNVVSTDGYLNLTRFYYPELGDIRKYAARMARLRDNLGRHGGNIFFVSPPSLVLRNHPDYATGLPWADENPIQDVFLNHLREFGIESLDARRLLMSIGMDPKDMVFRTDHHWTNVASFEVFKALVPRLEKAFGIALDPDGFYTNDANYNVRTYPKSFLGFLGRSTGAAFIGYEDFTVIWPKFHREYLSEIIDGAGLNIRRGPTEVSLLNTLRLTQREMYLSTMYDFYLYGIQPWARVVNLQNRDAPRVLMVVDSFGPPLATFLAPLFSEIQVVWPRAEYAKVDLDKFIEDNKFDYVIVELYAENISDNGIYYFASPEQPEETGEPENIEDRAPAEGPEKIACGIIKPKQGPEIKTRYGA